MTPTSNPFNRVLPDRTRPDTPYPSAPIAVRRRCRNLRHRSLLNVRTLKRLFPSSRGMAIGSWAWPDLLKVRASPSSETNSAVIVSPFSLISTGSPGSSRCLPVVACERICQRNPSKRDRPIPNGTQRGHMGTPTPLGRTLLDPAGPHEPDQPGGQNVPGSNPGSPTRKCRSEAMPLGLWAAVSGHPAKSARATELGPTHSRRRGRRRRLRRRLGQRVSGRQV
jgi:hypothetical protein